MVAPERRGRAIRRVKWVKVSDPRILLPSDSDGLALLA
jgi:hypothetical protein